MDITKNVLSGSVLCAHTKLQHRWVNRKRSTNHLQYKLDDNLINIKSCKRQKLTPLLRVLIKEIISRINVKKSIFIASFASV